MYQENNEKAKMVRGKEEGGNVIKKFKVFQDLFLTFDSCALFGIFDFNVLNKNVCRFRETVDECILAVFITRECGQANSKR